MGLLLYSIIAVPLPSVLLPSRVAVKLVSFVFELAPRVVKSVVPGLRTNM